MEIVTLSETAGQTPAGSFVVRINTTEPALTSEALGVYVDVAELLLEKEPVPLLQVTLEALPPIDPARFTAAPLQEARFAPASTCAAWFTARTVEPVPDVQPFTVTVTLYVPAFIAWAFVNAGSSALEVKPLGPVQL